MRVQKSQAADDSQLVETTIERRRSRWWTSWQFWLCGLLLSVTVIVVVLAVPIFRRAQALRYFDNNNVACGFSHDDAWITERFGEWAKPFRNATYIKFHNESAELWSNIAIFPEVRGLGMPVNAVTWGTVEHMRQMPRLRELDLEHVIDQRIDDVELDRILNEEWNVEYTLTIR